MNRFVASTFLPVPPQDVYAWHARPGAFERLVPPWDDIEVVESDHSIENGATLRMRIHKGPAYVTWLARHENHVPGEQFVDTQEEGPFSHWRHQHRFEPADGGTRLIDEVEYAIPIASALGLSESLTRPILERMFKFRHRRTQDDLLRHAAYKDKTPMKIAITGASGLLGTALTAFLRTGGHTVYPVVRGSAGPDQIAWSPSEGRIDAAALEGLDAVVHLAGETIAGLWTSDKRARILNSRVQGTTTLAKAIASLQNPPSTLISASAIGYYGNRGDARLDETSSAGKGFLADVCQQWEAPGRIAEEAGVRVVHPRLGLVLSAKGGALKQMLPPFRLGLGGPIGSGTQYMSWISLDDVLGAMLHVLNAAELSGPVNFTTPNPIQNRDFARTLGRVLNRPAVLAVPSFALKIATGEMGDALLLDSARVMPDKLTASGFNFLHPELDGALRAELGL